NIDYKGFKDGAAFEGGEAENFDLELGSGTFIPGFEDQLIGVKAGDEKDLDLTFPENYPAADLAGAAVVFHVKVNEVKEKVLPEVDDDFAKDCNIPQVETAEDLRNKIRETILRDKTAAAEQKADETFLDDLCAVADVEVPEVLVSREIDAMYGQLTQQIQAYGMQVDQYLRMTGMDENAVKESYRENAQKAVRQRLVLQAAAKAEGLEPTEDEIEEEYNNIAVSYNLDVNAVKAQLDTSLIKDDLLTRKAFDFLKDNAKH
ncbi:MAG: trigger factor, partial [Solobacterium sp.]|nr:trigger factor [Solobacterium sp.]